MVRKYCWRGNWQYSDKNMRKYMYIIMNASVRENLEIRVRTPRKSPQPEACQLNKCFSLIIFTTWSGTISSQSGDPLRIFVSTSCEKILR